MDYAIDKERFLGILKAIYEYNFKDEEGLINRSYPEMWRGAYAGDMLLPNVTGLVHSTIL
jgi:hypothetical protein